MLCNSREPFLFLVGRGERARVRRGLEMRAQAFARRGEKKGDRFKILTERHITTGIETGGELRAAEGGGDPDHTHTKTDQRCTRKKFFPGTLRPGTR